MKYTEYDLKLVDLIKSGRSNSFLSLSFDMDEENKALQPVGDRWRITGRRLQALRKQNRIAYLRDRQIWIVLDRSTK